LYAQASGLVSPDDCMAIHELYARVPGRVAPDTVTGVPSGSVPESQPSVSVAAPVPAQCAAWPMKTSVPLVKTKFAVH
jgi:hypothetical protein